MRKITITKTSDKWKLTTPETKGKHFSSPGRLITSIFKSTLASELNNKISVKVKVGSDTANESIASKDKDYLKFALTCFLEDFLPENRKTALLN